MPTDKKRTEISLWVATESGESIAGTIKASGSLSVPLIATYLFNECDVKEMRIVYEGQPLFGRIVLPDEIKVLLGPESIDFYIEGLSNDMGDYNRINLVFLGRSKVDRVFIGNNFRIALITSEEENCNEVIVTVESAYITR